MTDTDRLRTDPNRDASDSIRGYAYQIFQSALAWMNLDEGELLILEGAEDFDVYGADSVTTTQVKDLSQRLTLRSKSTLETLNNFWECKRRNPESEIRLRFLSTAEPGLEKGSPFGADSKGLDYWSKASRGAKELQLLRDFLLGLDLSDDLRQFLNYSSDIDFADQLLSRINWDLGEKPLQGLEFALEEKLKCHGLSMGVNAIESCRVLPHVIKHIVDLLCGSGAKELRLGDFLTCFDEATTVAVRQSSIVDRGLKQVLGGSNTTDIARVLSSAPVLSELGPIVDGGIPRAERVFELVDLIADQRVIFLNGSSGTGKTNLAILLAKEIGGSWVSISLRNRSADDTRDILSRAIFEIQRGETHPLLVIDDIELKQVSQFEREIISLIFLLTSAGGMVIVTGPTRPPLHLFPKIWKDEACDVEAPYFDDQEISALVHAHGQLDDDKVEQWSRIVWLNTFGHPQLVHARVRNLSAAGWPKLKVNDLTEPEDVERVRSEARMRLIQEFPSESTRDLAYRLSLINGSFSREMAIAVANAPPQLTLPGEAFDSLLGPWIERQGDNKYRVSPLLSGAANKVLAPAATQSVHRAIAASVLDKESVDQFEVGTALFHAYLGKYDPTLLKLTYSILTMDQKNLSYLYDAASWFTLIGLEKDQRLHPEKPSIDVMMRLVQYKLVTAAPGSENVSAIISRIEESLGEVEPDELGVYTKASAYGTILNTINVPIPSRDVVRLISNLIDLSKNHEFFEELSKGLQHSKLDLPRMGDNKPSQVLFSYQAARLTGIDDFADLVDSLDKLPSEKRDELLAVAKTDFEFSSLLVGRAWWKNVEAETLDPARAIGIFRSSIGKFREWGVPSLVKASLVAIAVLEDEYLKNSKIALATIDKAEREFPDDGDLLYQRAKIYSGMDAYSEVIPLASRALESDDLSNVDYVFCSRLAGISSAELEEWKEAQRFLEAGAERALKSELQEPMGIGLMADTAFALWNQEKYKDALMVFADCLDKLASIEVSDDIRTRYLHATIRHCISWVHFAARKIPDSALAEPYVGMCSSQEPNEKIRDHKIVSIGAAWRLLALTESVLELDAGINSRIPKVIPGESSLLLDTYQRGLAFDILFERRDFDQLIPCLVSMLEALPSVSGRRGEDVDFDAAREIPPLPSDFWEQTGNLDWIYVYVLAASAVCVAHDPKKELPLDHWRTDIAAVNALSPDVEGFLSALGGKEPDGSLYQTAAHGIFLLKGGTLTPDDLFRLSFRMLNAFTRERKKGAAALEKLLVDRWRFAAHHQRFQFRLPAKTCSDIEGLCRDKSVSGLGKIASILKIAAPSLNMRLGDDAVKMLDGFIGADK